MDQTDKPYVRPNAETYYELRVNKHWSYEDIASHFNVAYKTVQGGVSEYRKLRRWRQQSDKILPLPHAPIDDPPLDNPKIKQRHKPQAIRTLTYNDTDAATFWKRYKDLKQSKRFIKIAFPFDKHFPFHDPDALELDYLILSDIEPDMIIHGSDVFDFPTISKHEPDYELSNHPSFDDVLDNVEPYYIDDTDTLNNIAPDAIKPFIFGNHDTRFNELALASNTPKSLLKLFTDLIKHHGTVHYLGLTQELLLDSLFIRHDGGAGQNVAKLMLWKDNTVHHVVGHTHRPDYYCHAAKRFTGHSMVVGCRCLLIPHYQTKRGKHTTNWSQSLGIAILDTQTSNIQMLNYHYQRDHESVYAVNGSDVYQVKIEGSETA